MTADEAADLTAADQRSAEMLHYDRTVAPIVERFAADLTEIGMQRMAARVFACVLASEEGVLTSADLAERLLASAAAISGAVRYLAQMGMISRERAPGSRREHYRLHSDTWHGTVLSRSSALPRLAGTLRAGASQLGDDSAAGQRFLESSQFLEFLHSELEGVIERWKAAREQAGDEPPAPQRKTADDG